MRIFLLWDAIGKPDSCLIFVAAMACGSLENEDGLAVCILCLKAAVARARFEDEKPLEEPFEGLLRPEIWCLKNAVNF